MFPLKAILINRCETAGPDLLNAIRAHPASIEATFTSVEQMLEKGEWAPTERRLLVVSLGDLDDVEEIHRLKRTFPTWPILAALYEGNAGANLLVLANRAGAAQVVPSPIDPDDFTQALFAIAKDYNLTNSHGRVIAVSGANGGCGATTVAINLAYGLAQAHQTKTVVTELGLQRGMLAAYLNADPTRVIQDLLNPETSLEMQAVEEALTQIDHNFYILSGAHHSIIPGTYLARDTLRLVDHLRRVASTVIVDVPPIYDDQYCQMLSYADQVVLVAEQELHSLRSMRLFLDLFGRSNVADDIHPDAPIHLVLNRFDPDNERYEIGRVKHVLQISKLNTIPNDYASVSAALGSGRPLHIKAPQSKALRGIEQLIHALNGTVPDDPLEEESGLLGRLARATFAVLGNKQ